MTSINVTLQTARQALSSAAHVALAGNHVALTRAIVRAMAATVEAMELIEPPRPVAIRPQSLAQEAYERAWMLKRELNR